MRIDTLRVRNFRCFAQQDFSFHPEFNVLIGDNGAGKTAVMEALAIAIGRWPYYVTRADAEKATIASDDVRIVGRTTDSRVTFYEENPTVIDTKLAYSGRIFQLQDVRMSTRSDADTYPVPQIMESDKNDLFALAQVARRAPTREAPPSDLPIFAYYSTERFVRPEEAGDSDKAPLTQQDISRNEGYLGCLKAAASSSLFTRWMQYEDWSEYRKKSESPAYQAVKTALRGMVEGAREVFYDSESLQVVIEFENGVVAPFKLLSDGQRNMLALAGDIASRMARLNPHLDGAAIFEVSGVILIDELDLHLHPHWQRHVVADLRRTFPNVQFITTTHSPQILSEIEPECVTILRREGDIVMATKPVQSYGLDTNGVLGNLMGTAARPALVQNKIDAVDDALEEGEWERARSLVNDLRTVLNGDDPETVRLDASTYAMEALADAVD